MEVQKCKQCGEVKSLTQFRKYYGKLKGHYKACKDCEKINQRYKYLLRRSDTKPLNEAEQREVAGIEELYAVQRSAGLVPPQRRNEKEGQVFGLLEAQKARIQERLEQEQSLSDDIPEPIAKMLNMSFEAEVPEELQERVDKLWEEFRPIIRIDASGPVYDNRYTEYLNQLQSKVDQYEEEFYG